jgi:hypothetical protein
MNVTKNKRGPRARALVIMDRWKDRGYTRNEWNAIMWHILHFYLDSENYPNAYNLRLARRFDGKELDGYYQQADRGTGNFYDTTVYTHDGSFYLGWNYAT